MAFFKKLFKRGRKNDVVESESTDYFDNRDSLPGVGLGGGGIAGPPGDFEGGFGSGPPPPPPDGEYPDDMSDDYNPLESISEANTSETSSWHPRQSGKSRSTATSYRSQSSMFEYGAPHIGRESDRSSAYTESRPMSEYSDRSSAYTQSRPQSEYSDGSSVYTQSRPPSQYPESQYSQSRPVSEYSEYSDYPESEYSQAQSEDSRPPTLPPRQEGTLNRLNQVASKLESLRESRQSSRSRASRFTRGATSYRGSRATDRSRASQYTKQSQSRPESQYSEYSDYSQSEGGYTRPQSEYSDYSQSEGGYTRPQSEYSDYSQSEGGYTRPQSEYSDYTQSEYDDGSRYSQSQYSEYSDYTQSEYDDPSRPQSQYSEYTDASRPQSQYSQGGASRPQSAMTARPNAQSYRPGSSRSSRFSGRSRKSRKSGRSARGKSGRSVWSRRSKAQSRMVSTQMGIKPIPEDGEYESRVSSFATQEGGRGPSMAANGGVRMESQKSPPENLVVGSPSRYYKTNTGRWVATQSTRINFVPTVLKRVTMNVQQLGFGGKLAVKRKDPKEHYFDEAHSSTGSNGSKENSYIGAPPKTLQKAIRDPNARRGPIPSQWTRVVTNHWQNFRTSLMPKRMPTPEAAL